MNQCCILTLHETMYVCFYVCVCLYIHTHTYIIAHTHTYIIEMGIPMHTYHTRIYHKQMKKRKPSRFCCKVLSRSCSVPEVKKNKGSVHYYYACIDLNIHVMYMCVCNLCVRPDPPTDIYIYMHTHIHSTLSPKP